MALVHTTVTGVHGASNSYLVSQAEAVAAGLTDSGESITGRGGAVTTLRHQCELVEEGVLMCGYESNEEMEARLLRLQKKYPQLAKVTTLGKSVQGRKLTAITISANASDRVLGIPRVR